MGTTQNVLDPKKTSGVKHATSTSTRVCMRCLNSQLRRLSETEQRWLDKRGHSTQRLVNDWSLTFALSRDKHVTLAENSTAQSKQSLTIFL
jgi:hypothetical protein